MTDIDERVERYLAGEMLPEERVAFEDQVLANAGLADQLYSDASMHAVIATAARARRERAVSAAGAQPWWRRRMVQWLAPTVAVAAVAIFMLVQRPPTPEAPPVFRSPGGEFAAVEPQGDVAARPSRFVWRATTEASHYRFELFGSASSTPVFTTVTADTLVEVSLTATPVPMQGYWTVAPLNDLRIGIGESILTHYQTIE